MGKTPISARVRPFLRLMGDRKPLVFIFILVLVCSALEGVGAAAILPVLELVINQNVDSKFAALLKPFLNPNDPTNAVTIALFVLLSVIAIKGLATLSYTAYSAWYANTLRKKWREKIFEKILMGEMRFFQSRALGEQVENVINQTTVASKTIGNIAQIVANFCLGAALLFVLFQTSFEVTLILLVVVSVLGLIANHFALKFSSRSGERQLKLHQKVSRLITETLMSLRQIKVFSLEGKKQEQLRRLLFESRSLMTKIAVFQKAPPVVGEWMVATLIALGVLMLSSPASIKEAFPTIAMYIFVARRLSTLASEVITLRNRIQLNLPSVKLIDQMIESKVVLEQLTSGASFRNLTTGLRIENLGFQHEGRNLVFNNASMTIPRGKIVVVSGASGAGKSTLADLLIGLQRPNSGKIMLDNEDISHYSLLSWRKKIGIVSQDTLLLNGTIAENIRVGKPNATQAEVEEAARLSDAHDFIMDQPRGYQTILGDHGAKISGGQRQRIAIARAIIRKPDFLILDEPTSALDEESATKIFDSVRALSKNATVLYITHDPRAQEEADLLYKIEDSQIKQISN